MGAARGRAPAHDRAGSRRVGRSRTTPAGRRRAGALVLAVATCWFAAACEPPGDASAPAPGDGAPATAEPPVATAEPPAATGPAPGGPAPGAPQPSASATPPVTTDSGNPGTAGDLDAFLEACEDGVEEWRRGRLEYPALLRVDLDDSVTYVAALDVTADAPPPTQVPGPSPTSAPVDVRCGVSARLVPLGDGLAVDEEGWVDRAFTPTGVVRWSWAVHADEPGDDDVRIELRPAVAVGDDVVTGAAVAEYVTAVDVRTPFVRSLGDWWVAYWGTIALVAAGLGAAVLGLRGWWRKVRHGTAE